MITPSVMPTAVLGRNAVRKEQTGTCGSVINWWILKWIFVVSICHLCSLGSCSISNAASCHVTQITAVYSCRSNEIVSFHLLRSAHVESRTDGERHAYTSLVYNKQTDTKYRKHGAKQDNRKAWCQ